MCPSATSSQERKAQGEAAARMPQSDVKATVVPCPTPPADDDFVGTLRGKQVRLQDVKEEKIYYRKRTPEEADLLRKEFDSTEKKKFLQSLADDPEKVQELRKAGFTEKDLAALKKGSSPGRPGEWQVHHKLPLDDGGTNAPDNLVLIKNDPFHQAITNAQRQRTAGLSPGEGRVINWPIPQGSVYPANG
jgi:hypothetical protein